MNGIGFGGNWATGSGTETWNQSTEGQITNSASQIGARISGWSTKLYPIKLTEEEKKEVLALFLISFGVPLGLLLGIFVHPIFVIISPLVVLLSPRVNEKKGG